MHICRYLPGRCVHPQTRGSTLLWLDALGKWSIIDLFVMIVMLAALRQRLLLPKPVADLLPPDFLVVGLQVSPQLGLTLTDWLTD